MEMLSNIDVQLGRKLKETARMHLTKYKNIKLAKITASRLAKYATE
jgi:hypothetical protein